jgi:hypothetical protein
LGELFNTARLLDLFDLWHYVDVVLTSCSHRVGVAAVETSKFGEGKKCEDPPPQPQTPFLSLLGNSSLCNVSIIAGGVEGPPPEFSMLASQSVLAAVSPYFNEVFSGRWLDTMCADHNGRICVHVPDDMRIDTLQDLLHYMYSGDGSLRWILSDANNERVVNLMQWSQFFMMPELFDAGQYFLSSHLSFENVCDVWTLSMSLGAEELEENAKQFFVQNFFVVSSSAGFGRLDKEYLRAALNTGQIQASMSFVISALKRWAHFQIQLQQCSSSAADLHGGSNAQGTSSSIVISDSECLKWIEDLLPPNTFFTFQLRNLLLGVHGAFS